MGFGRSNDDPARFSRRVALVRHPERVVVKQNGRHLFEGHRMLIPIQLRFSRIPLNDKHIYVYTIFLELAMAYAV